MAQRIRLLPTNRQVVLQEPENAQDAFLRSLTDMFDKYSSPEYQRMKRDEQRADARLELQGRQQFEAEELQDENIAMARRKELREKDIYERQIEQEEEIEFKQEWDSLIYNEKNQGTRGGIELARGWLDKSDIDPATYSLYDTKLKQDEAVLNKQDEDTDNLGNLLSSMNPDFQYDSSDSMRQMVRNSGDFMLQNSISQKYLGAMSPEMQVMYKQDMSDLSGLVKQALLSSDVSAQNEFIKSVIKPAYDSMVKNYGAQGQDISSPAVEGLLSRAGVPIDSEDDTNLAKELGGMDKPTGIGDDSDDPRMEALSKAYGAGYEYDPDSFLNRPPIAAIPVESTIASNTPRGEATKIKKALDRTIKLGKGNPKSALAGANLPEKRKIKFEKQINELIKGLTNVYNPDTKEIIDPRIRKIFNKMAGKNKDEYYSLLDSIFSAKDDFSLDRLIRTERRPGKKKMRNPFLPIEG